MNEETLFQEALSRSPEERAAFLEQACAGRPELRGGRRGTPGGAREVRATFSTGPRPRPWIPDLARSVLTPPSTTLRGQTTHLPQSPRRPTIAPKCEAGIVIAGRYTLQEKIGEGGMGEVWVAKQTEPVKRKVALKLIKTGMDSKAVLQRFEQERQALAMMDHPNIARCSTAASRPPASRSSSWSWSTACR